MKRWAGGQAIGSHDAAVVPVLGLTFPPTMEETRGRLVTDPFPPCEKNAVYLCKCVTRTEYGWLTGL